MKKIVEKFQSKSGHDIAAIIELPDKNPKALSVYSHCFTCSKNLKSVNTISKTLVENGIGVLRFDFAGIGGSSGNFSDTNFSTNLLDLESAVEYLEENHGPPSLMIGHSLGGAATIARAADFPSVKAVVVIGAPATLSHLEKKMNHIRKNKNPDGAIIVNIGGADYTLKTKFFEDMKNYNILNSAAKINKPFLILHSPVDMTVGIDNAAKLFQKARHPKSFISLDDADHILTKKSDAEYAGSVISAWFEKYI